MPIFKCPECENEIEYLNYREEVITYGTYNINTENSDTEETEPCENDSLRYTCPGCGREIEIIDIIREEDENEETPEPGTLQEAFNSLNPFLFDPTLGPNQDEDNHSGRELPVPPAVETTWRGEYSGFHNSHNQQKPTEILICPQCGNKIEAEIDEDIECHHCNKNFNRATAKKIIQIN